MRANEIIMKFLTAPFRWVIWAMVKYAATWGLYKHPQAVFFVRMERMAREMNRMSRTGKISARRIPALRKDYIALRKDLHAGMCPKEFYKVANELVDAYKHILSEYDRSGIIA